MNFLPFFTRIAHTARVTWQEARTIALKWIDDLNAKRGDIILLPDFGDESDCQEFAGRRLAFHRMIVKAAGRSARARGMKVVPHKISLKSYRAHIAEQKLADFPEERQRYYLSQAKIVPNG